MNDIKLRNLKFTRVIAGYSFTMGICGSSPLFTFVSSVLVTLKRKTFSTFLGTQFFANKLAFTITVVLMSRHIPLRWGPPYAF